jgi:hypothetical protein
VINDNQAFWEFIARISTGFRADVRRPGPVVPGRQRVSEHLDDHAGARFVPIERGPAGSRSAGATTLS